MSPATSAAEQVDVVVVGAGWSGLISAKTYLEFKPSANLIIIDDQKSIGGVWCCEKIYPDLYAQIQHGLFEFSFYQMRHEGISDDGYISGYTINTYLNEFARDHRLVQRTRLQTKVTSISRPVGDKWRLTLAGKPPVECEKLIFATGPVSHPVIPKWPKSGGFHVPTIHSSQLGMHLDSLKKIQSATVVGGAKSSYDIVFILLKAGKKVDWIIREDGSGPLAIMPPTILGLVNTTAVMTTRAMAFMGHSIMEEDGLVQYFFHQTTLGRLTVWLFWLVLNWIADRDAGYSKSENAAKLRPTPNGSGVYWAQAGLGAASVPSFWKTFHGGDCEIHRTNIRSLGDDNKIHLEDGSHLEPDYLILATGYDKSVHVFSEEVLYECGFMHHSDPTSAEEKKWAKLEVEAAVTVDRRLPALAKHPLGLQESPSLAQGKTMTGSQKPPCGPSRHFRCLIAPSLAAAGDRTIFFPGFAHVAYTPLVCEVQALWGVAFLLGLHDPPSLGEMERDIAEWIVWSKKRYPAQGRKHAYAIYDFLSYIDLLLKDLGLNPRRRAASIPYLFSPTYPSDYEGLISEYRRSLKGKAPTNVI